MSSSDPEHSLRDSWSIGRLRPWLQLVAQHEMPANLRGRVDPSDIVQQTLLKAWQGESDFRGDTHEQRLAWLRVIVRNTIRDQHRQVAGTQKRGNGRELAAADAFAQDEVGLNAFPARGEQTVSGEMIAAEEALEFAAALENLSNDQRRVIELRHLEGLTHGQIAEKLGKTEPAVRMLWVRALRALAAHLC